jgi:Spy/CpxP family protein refolding chaperone
MMSDRSSPTEEGIMSRLIVSGMLAVIMAFGFSLTPVFADPEGKGYEHGKKDGYSREGHGYGGGMGGHGMGMMHSSTGHLIRHLLKHEKDIGLTDEQVTKLKAMQLDLDKLRIKSEADIQVAERELKALVDDEKSDLGAIESKLKQSEDFQVSLRLASIKARRDVLALLTPEQRGKEKAEHDKMMQQHKERGSGSGTGSPHGGMKRDQ